MMNNQLKKIKYQNRPTIAFLVDNLSDKFEERIWDSVINAAKQFDLNLLGYVGGSVSKDCNTNSIYNLIDNNLIDGIISISGSLGWLLSEAELIEFYQRFRPLPIVSISRAIDGLANILVDNESGIRQLMTHLIEVHQYRRIAFITGLSGNSDAEARLQTYKQVLAEYNIPYNPDLVVPGNFYRETGSKAISILLDERKVGFDAILAANDYMAIYAMKELQRRGIRVPEDVALVGFDDIPDGISVIPSLTTVSQPLSEIGWEAVKTINHLIKGEPVPDKKYFSTMLVVRRSCGCMVANHIDADVNLPDNKQYVLTNQKTLTPRGVEKIITAHFNEFKDKMFYQNWAFDLANSLHEWATNADCNQFFLTLESAIIKEYDNVSLTLWYQVLELLTKIYESILLEEQKEELYHLFKKAFAVVGKIAEQIQIAKRIRYEEQYIILQKLYEQLITLLDDEGLKNLLAQKLSSLGIHSFYLSLYENQSLETSYLYYYYNLSNNVIINKDQKTFPSKQLIPGEFVKDRERFAYVILPLHYKEEQIGFSLCEIGSLEAPVYDTLINQVSTALKVTTLVKEVRQYALELEQKVEERTKELKTAHNQLIEAAHQAGMAEVAIGVMHNIGNLLNSVSISTEEICNTIKYSKLTGLDKANQLLDTNRENLATFFANDSKAALLPDYYLQITQSLKGEHKKIWDEALQLIEKTALMREIIRTLQDYASSNIQLVFEEKVEISSIIDNALKIQESNLNKNDVKIIKQYEAIEPIETHKTKLTHILVNLIKNAVEAMRGNRENESILKIKLYQNELNNIVIEVSDNGEGIAPENLKKIFTYGFTTKADGHGFGLHTCANYLNEMGGNISVHSDGIGKGATFKIVLNKKQEEVEQ